MKKVTVKSWGKGLAYLIDVQSGDIHEIENDPEHSHGFFIEQPTRCGIFAAFGCAHFFFQNKVYKIQHGRFKVQCLQFLLWEYVRISNGGSTIYKHFVCALQRLKDIPFDPTYDQIDSELEHFFKWLSSLTKSRKKLQQFVAPNG